MLTLGWGLASLFTSSPNDGPCEGGELANIRVVYGVLDLAMSEIFIVDRIGQRSKLFISGQIWHVAEMFVAGLG